MTNPFHPYNPPRLTVELVPVTQWKDNLRSILSKGRWDDLRKACYVRAHHRCEICGGVGRKHPVECHEIWEYDDNQRIQKLMGLISLCPSCHQVKHAGFAISQGWGAKVLLQLMQVNQWPESLAEAYLIRQFEIHALRSQLTWTLDLSWLDNANDYIDKTTAYARQARSQRVLSAMQRKTSDDKQAQRIALKTHDRASAEGDNQCESTGLLSPLFSKP